MKTMYKVIIPFMLLLFVAPAYAGKRKATEFTKEVNKTFSVNKDATFDISNKYGNVHINTWDKNEIKIDVTILVNVKDEAKANAIFEKVSIDLSGSASLVSAVTEIKKFKMHNSNLKINYEVQMPSTNALKLKNKFGNAFVDKLSGKADISLQYGDLTSNNLSFANNKVELAFGSATINEMQNAEIDLQYSTLNFKKVANVSGSTQFSTLNVDGKAGDIQLKAQYDTYKFDEVESLDIDGQFTQLKAKVLNKSAVIVSQYGGIDIAKVAAGFSEIKVENQFAPTNFVFESGASFTFDVDTKFAEVKLPKGAKIKEKEESTTGKSYSGSVGNSGGASVSISTQYGNAELTIK